MQLNAEQQRAVDIDDHCQVVACPGSGKTRVVTRKIAAILKRQPKSTICAVTFTRDSAHELQERTIKEISEDKFRRHCRIGTFHSLTIKQLRSAGKLGKVASPSEQAVYLRRAIALADPTSTYEDAARLIEAAKTALTPCPEMESALYLAYSELLKRNQVEDLYDVVRNALTRMQRGEIKPYPVNHMLVDEFQDTDRIQKLWVLFHAQNGTSVTVVGDDDQSIYSWRGALGYSGMEEFVTETKAQLITLAVNYRSHAEILDVADRLIQHNQDRVPKALHAFRGTGGRVHSFRCASRNDEAEQLGNHIAEDATPIPPGESAVFTRTVAAGKWAVLARNKRLLDKVEAELQALQIRYTRSKGDSIWARPPFVFMLELLKSIGNGERSGIDHALAHALQRKVSARAANDVLDLIHTQFPEDMYRLLDGAAVDLSKLVEEEASIVKAFCKRTSGWREQARQGRFSMVIRGVAEWFGTMEDSPSDGEFIVSMGERIVTLKGSLVERVTALGRTTTESVSDGVALHTMHSSKGLEFDNVWIVGAEATIIPSPKNPVYEEERRLMYVAMTRAKDRLFISSASPDAPSPFVIEAGLDPRESVCA